MLSGEIDEPANGKLFLVHSPVLDSNPTILNGVITISLAEQTTEKAPFVVYATLDYSEGSIQDVIATFAFATSVVRVSCTGLTSGSAISSAKVSDVNTACVLSLTGGAVAVSGAEAGSIVRSGADGFNSVNAEGDASFQFAVPALGTAAARTLTITQGELEFFDSKFSKASMTPNLSVNTICTMFPASSQPDDDLPVSMCLFYKL